MVLRFLPPTILLASLCIASDVIAQCDYEVVEPLEYRPTILNPINLNESTIVVDGEFMAMNSSGVPDSSDELGGVSVLRRAGHRWVDDGFIPNPADVPDSSFGSAMAMHGSWLAIAAPEFDETGADRAGRIYVYERADGQWQLRQTIQNKIVQGLDRLGSVLAMTENELFARVFRGDDPTPHQHAVHVYRRDETDAWPLHQVILNPLASAPIDFGASISVEDHHLVITAPSYIDPHTGRRGLMYEYFPTSGEWEFHRGFYPFTPAAAGAGTARKNGVMATIVHANKQSDTPAVNVLELDPHNVFTHRATVPIPSLHGEGDPLSGVTTDAIATDGNIIVVARLDASIDGRVGGALHVLERDGEGWRLRMTHRPTMTRVADNKEGVVNVGFPMFAAFGADVAMSNGQLFVRAGLYMGVDEAAPHAPCVLVYDVEDVVGFDANQNDVCDAIDFVDGTLEGDADLNGRPDAWEIKIGAAFDCNANGVIDAVDEDCDGNGVPDACDPDCNENGFPDSCEVLYSSGGLPAPLVPFAFEEGRHGVILRQIVVEEGAEIVSECTVRRGYVRQSTPLDLVMYHDPTKDGDPVDAILLAQIPLPLKAAWIRNGATVSFDPIELGSAGDHVYVGLYNPRRYENELPFLVRWDQPHPEDRIVEHEHGVFYGWDSGKQNLSDLSTAPYSQEAPFRVAVDLHAGPRGLCCTVTDLDGDGLTSTNDLLELLSEWGLCPSPCDADFDHSGEVGVLDLLILLGNWGACTSSAGS